jgi:hypothetical protein
MRIRTLRSPKGEVAIRDCINWFEAHKYQKKNDSCYERICRVRDALEFAAPQMLSTTPV